MTHTLVFENARVVLPRGRRRRLGGGRRRAHRRGRGGPGARARHRPRRRPAGAGADRAAHRPPGEPPQAAARRCIGRRWRRSWPTTRRSRRRASPRCSTRCASATTLDYGSQDESSTASSRRIDTARSQDLLRADHRLHLRCEICADDVVEQTERLLDRHAVGLISLMDHTPGTRQFVDLGGLEDLLRRQVGSARGRARPLHGAGSGHSSPANYASNRAALVALARARSVVMASHDDATPEHVQESIADGAAIAEFPTTAGGRGCLASRPASPC